MPQLKDFMGIGSTALGFAGQLITNRQNERLAQQSNALTYQMFNEGNAFNASEAEKARNYETEMSNTAYQRQVSDMQAAGLNPALLYGESAGSAASTPSGSAANAASAGSVATPQFGNPIESALKSRALEAEVRNIESKTEGQNNENEAFQKRLAAELRSYNDTHQISLSTLDEVKSRISMIQAQTQDSKQSAELKKVQTDIAEYEKVRAGIDAENWSKLTELAIHAKELENARSEVSNEYQRQQLEADLSKTEAEINNLYTTAGAAALSASANASQASTAAGQLKETIRWNDICNANAAADRLVKSNQIWTLAGQKLRRIGEGVEQGVALPLEAMARDQSSEIAADSANSEYSGKLFNRTRLFHRGYYR